MCMEFKLGAETAVNASILQYGSKTRVKVNKDKDLDGHSCCSKRLWKFASYQQEVASVHRDLLLLDMNLEVPRASVV